MRSKLGHNCTFSSNLVLFRMSLSVAADRRNINFVGVRVTGCACRLFSLKGALRASKLLVQFVEQRSIFMRHTEYEDGPHKGTRQD